jgi:hypothetical protein
MFRNATLAVSAALFTLLTCAAPALAADPTKIGKNIENLVTPNVKSLWIVGLIIGVLAILFTRPKGSFIAAFFVAVLVSGSIIYNPSGFAQTISAIGDKVL